MRLGSLAARNFRNLAEFHLEPHPRFNVIAGPNAQGKTNLLEAVFVLSALKSFRTAQHRELVRFDEARATVTARIERDDGQLRQVRLELDPQRRRIQLDGQNVRRLADYLGTLRVVLFAPEDVALLKGAPSERRTFLDRAVFNSRASYLEDLNATTQILKQRNALLRDDSPRLDLLEVYTDQLIDSGARVVSARLEWLAPFRAFFAAAFGDIFGHHLPVELVVEPSWADCVDLDALPSRDAIADQMRAAFTARRRDELRRGVTLVGPHRDDFTVLLGGRNARLHASQGQHRALVLALKTSEITMLRERFQIEPVLLLDDVSSELDRERNAQLFAFLAGFQGQVFISTTGREHILLEHELAVWHVQQGVLTPATSASL